MNLTWIVYNKRKKLKEENTFTKALQYARETLIKEKYDYLTIWVNIDGVEREVFTTHKNK